MKCIRNIVLMSALVLTLACAFASVCWADVALDLQQCKNAIAAAEYPEAIGYGQDVIKARPGSDEAAQATFLIALAYKGEKQYEQAIQELTQAISDYPSFAAKARLGVADCCIEQNQLSDAESLLKRALELTADDDAARKEMMYRLAVVCRRLKQWDDAQAACKSIVADYPGEAGRVESEQATIALYQMKDSVQSMAKDDSLRKEMIYKLALAFRSRQLWDDALELYNCAAGDYVDEAAPCCQEMADTYVAKGDIENAIALCLETATKCAGDPRCAGVLFKLAEIQCLHGKPADGVATLDKIYADYPDSRALALLRKGQVQANFLRKPEDAIATLQKVISDYGSDPSAKAALRSIAHITLYCLKKADEARALLEQLIEKYPDYNTAEVQYCLGYCSYIQEDWSSAKSKFEDIFDNYPVEQIHVVAKYRIADCCTKLGDTEGARKTLEELITSFPTSPRAELARKQLDAMNAGSK